MKINFKNTGIVIVLLCISVIANAQEKIQQFELKKGEIFDVLLLNTKPDTQSLFKEYRERVFPYGQALSYSTMAGIGIKETTQGSYQPQVIVLAKWDNKIKREKFLSEIEEKVPDFHGFRRKIWSSFNLTYYEIPTDTTFELDRNKIVVVTAYWKNEGDTTQFNEFIAKWKNDVSGSGGHVKIELQEGISPFGYYYNPDFMVVSQWNTRADFDGFLKKNKEMDHQGVKHVNQFVLVQ